MSAISLKSLKGKILSECHQVFSMQYAKNNLTAFLG